MFSFIHSFFIFKSFQKIITIRSYPYFVQKICRVHGTNSNYFSERATCKSLCDVPCRLLRRSSFVLRVDGKNLIP